MEQPKLTSPVVTAEHCANLRHKGMYVMTAADPEEFKFYDRYDAPITGARARSVASAPIAPPSILATARMAALRASAASDACHLGRLSTGICTRARTTGGGTLVVGGTRR